MFGGLKGNPARHYVFQGFQDSTEFYEHFQTLDLWSSEQKQPQTPESEALEVQYAMEELIEAAADVKDMQKE